MKGVSTITKSIVKATFACDMELLWKIVTSLELYGWRSDISKIEIVNDREFIEYTKSGYATRFKITEQKSCTCWSFDMENENMKGHWTGEFMREKDETLIVFTEDVVSKKSFMKPFVKLYLKKQQQQYIKDLRKALEYIK